MSCKRTLLNATCLSGALVLAVAGPALADCSVENPGSAQTTVCDGPLTRAYDFANDEFTVVVNGEQSLDAPVALYRARGAAVNVQVSADASVTNTGAGKVLELGANAGLDNAGTLTATGTAVSMSDAADFSNTGIIVSNTHSGAAAVVIGDRALSIANSGTIRSSGVGVQIGSEAGDFINSGLIESTGDGDRLFLHAVRIDSLADGAKVVNTGTIRAAGDIAYGIRFNGAAVLENRGEISASGADGIGVWGGESSAVTNDGTIRSSGIAVRLGAGSSLVNSGLLESDHDFAVALGDNAVFENSGTVTGRGDAVVFGADGRLLNQAGGAIVSSGVTAPAVTMGGGASTLINAGLIDNEGVGLAPGRSLILISADIGETSRVTNEVGGVIGRAAAAEEVNAVATQPGSGSILVENLGTIYGSIELTGAQGSTVFNGLSLQMSSPDAPGTALLQGDVRFGAGADSLRNNGLLQGGVQFGDGADLAINYQGARITGGLDFGDGADTFVHRGLVDGDVLMGDGDDELFLAGVVGGAIDLGAGVDVLDIGGSGLFGADQVVQGGAGSDTLIMRGAMAFDGAQFAGFERFEKAGSGDATLTGHWRFDEGMKVTDGVLTLDDGATLAGGLMTVKTGYDIHGLHDGDVRVEGGELFGWGQIGAGGASPARTLTNAGLVAPGSPFGPSPTFFATLTVQGDYVQTGEGRLDIELGAPDELDILHVTGTASLNGTVRFVPLDMAVAGQDYVFIRADGGVVGEFATVQGGLFFDYFVDYGTPGQVSVRLVAAEESEPPLLEVLDGLTPNQAAVRGAFVSPGAFSPDLALVRADLNGVGAQRAPAALDSLSGEAYAALPAAVADAHRRFADGLVGRGRGFDFHEGEAAGVWAAAYGWRSKVDGDPAFAGRSVDTSGFAMGADRIFAPGLRLGVAVGGSETDLKQARTRSDGEIRSLEGGVYAAVRGESAWLDAAVTYGDHEVKASRTLITGVASERHATGDMSARSVRADVLGGIERPVGGLAVRPYAGLSWTLVRQDGLVERGAADAGLKVQAETYEATIARAGVSAAGAVELSNGVELDFGGQLELDRDLARQGWSAKARLIGGGDGFRIATAAPGETGLTAGAWATARLSRGWSLYADYDFETAEDARGHAVSLGARLAW